MTPTSDNGAGPMTQARAYDEKPMTQPRRYFVRRLRDSEGLTERQIAEQTGISQKTVNRDLKETVEPVDRTPGGAPIYPPGRFDNDPDFRHRVAELAHDMPEANARLEAAREFAGPPRHPGVKRLRTSEAQAELQQKAIKAAQRA